MHVTPELRTKHNRRTVRPRVGDRVKVVRGTYKGKMGKIESIDIKLERVCIEKVEVTRKEGSKIKKPVAISNCIIVELNTSDKKRFSKPPVKKQSTKPVQSKKPNQSDNDGKSTS